MDTLTIYLQAWQEFFLQYLEFGLKEADLRITMEWEGVKGRSRIVLYLTKRIYQILKRTAEHHKDGLGDLFNGLETETPSRSDLIILYVPGIYELTMVQCIIALSFPLLQEEKAAKVRANNQQIEDAAHALIPTKDVIWMGKVYYKRGKYYLPLNLGDREDIQGKSPKEVIEKLKKLLEK